MKKVFTMLFFENDSASLSKILTFLYFLLFAGVSIYLAAYNISWSSYEVFALIAGGGGTAAQISHKFINSKYNTAPGSFDQTPGQVRK